MDGNEPGCRVVVDDVEEIFGELSSRVPVSGPGGGRPALTPLELKPWGLKEFTILDPDINALHVAESAV
jgi:hypothetical protein